MLISFEDFIRDFPNEQLSAAIGVFDGIHLGHLKLIENIKTKAKQLKLRSAIITFDPNPKLVLNKSNYCIYCLADNYRLIKEQDVDFVIHLRFDDYTRMLSKEEFIKNYLQKLNIKYLLSGINFRFGFKSAGSADDLIVYSETNGFNYDVHELLGSDGEEVSSTVIKSSIEKYLVSKVNKLLNGFYIHFDLNVSAKEMISERFSLQQVNVRSFIKPGIYTIVFEEQKHLLISFSDYSYILSKVEMGAIEDDRAIVKQLLTTVPSTNAKHLESMAEFALRI
jgi:FAD synthase